MPMHRAVEEEERRAEPPPATRSPSRLALEYPPGGDLGLASAPMAAAAGDDALPPGAWAGTLAEFEALPAEARRDWTSLSIAQGGARLRDAGIDRELLPGARGLVLSPAARSGERGLRIGDEDLAIYADEGLTYGIQAPPGPFEMSAERRAALDETRRGAALAVARHQGRLTQTRSALDRIQLARRTLEEERRSLPGKRSMATMASFVQSPTGQGRVRAILDKARQGGRISGWERRLVEEYEASARQLDRIGAVDEALEELDAEQAQLRALFQALQAQGPPPGVEESLALQRAMFQEEDEAAAARGAAPVETARRRDLSAQRTRLREELRDAQSEVADELKALGDPRSDAYRSIEDRVEREDAAFHRQALERALAAERRRIEERAGLPEARARLGRVNEAWDELIGLSDPGDEEDAFRRLKERNPGATNAQIREALRRAMGGR